MEGNKTLTWKDTPTFTCIHRKTLNSELLRRDALAARSDPFCIKLGLTMAVLTSTKQLVCHDE
jgi:hypothetical protein